MTHTDSTFQLFVYGTIKRGFPNHSRLSGHITGEPVSARIGPARLWDAGYFPCLELAGTTSIMPAAQTCCRRPLSWPLL